VKRSAVRSTRSKRNRDGDTMASNNNETTIVVDTSETSTPIQETPVATGNRSTRQSSRRRQAIAPNDELFVRLKSNMDDDNDTPIATDNNNNNNDSPLAVTMKKNEINMTDTGTKSITETMNITSENKILQYDQSKSSKHIEGTKSQRNDNTAKNQNRQIPTKIGGPEIVPSGWLTVYPQGPERKKMYYEKQKINGKNSIETTDQPDPDDDSTKIICMEPAVTVYVKGLVRTKPSSIVSSQSHFNGSNRPDYKAFRKNHVPDPILQSVRLQTFCATKGLPIVNDANESQQRKHIEAQQRRLDDLFR
jgi:hypothetical protein